VRQEGVIDDGDELFLVVLQLGLVPFDGLGQVVGNRGDDLLRGLVGCRGCRSGRILGGDGQRRGRGDGEGNG